MMIPDVEIVVEANCPKCAASLEVGPDGWTCESCELTWDLNGEHGTTA